MHDLRFEATRTVTETRPQLVAPALLVLDAFNGGGNQSETSHTDALGAQASETVTAQFGRHLVKSGILFEGMRRSSTDLSGFGGTFIFGADVERNGPAILAVTRGARSISHRELPTRSSACRLSAVTVFDRPRQSSSASTSGTRRSRWTTGRSGGLRTSFGVDKRSEQYRPITHAPRAALSWLRRTGKERDRWVPESSTDAWIGHYVLCAKDERNRSETVRRQRPPFYDPPASESEIPVQSTIYAKSADLRVPLRTRLDGYARQLPRGLFAVVQYTSGRGMNLLRLRDVTAESRPTFQFESTGRSSQRELMLGLRGDISATFTLHGNYRLGTRKSDTDGPWTAPANSLDLSTEYGYAADDQRHQFEAGLGVKLPGDVLIDSSASIASGRPFNITTGRDNDGNTLFADRPAFAQPGDVGAVATAFGVFNPNPRPGDQLIPRNFGRDPWLMNLNLAVSKVIEEDFWITIDVENVLNTSRLFASNGA